MARFLEKLSGFRLSPCYFAAEGFFSAISLCSSARYWQKVCTGFLLIRRMILEELNISIQFWIGIAG